VKESAWVEVSAKEKAVRSLLHRLHFLLRFLRFLHFLHFPRLRIVNGVLAEVCLEVDLVYVAKVRLDVDLVYVVAASSQACQGQIPLLE